MEQYVWHVIIEKRNVHIFYFIIYSSDEKEKKGNVSATRVDSMKYRMFETKTHEVNLKIYHHVVWHHSRIYDNGSIIDSIVVGLRLLHCNSTAK